MVCRYKSWQHYRQVLLSFPLYREGTWDSEVKYLAQGSREWVDDPGSLVPSHQAIQPFFHGCSKSHSLVFKQLELGKHCPGSLWPLRWLHFLVVTLRSVPLIAGLLGDAPPLSQCSPSERDSPTDRSSLPWGLLVGSSELLLWILGSQIPLYLVGRFLNICLLVYL